MPYYAIYETATGRLVSLGNMIADPLPQDLTAVDIGTAVDLRGQMWDAASKAFVARPAPVLIDRLDDLRAMTGVPALWASLSAAQKLVLGNAIIKLLGGARYRKASQPVEVQPVEA